MENLEIIHIGKCGGSSIGAELRKHNISFTKKHLSKPVYDPNKNYIIMIRNPIKRFISSDPGWVKLLSPANKLEFKTN